jgi:hypothetical protein
MSLNCSHKGPIVHPPDDMSTESHSEMILTRKAKNSREKPVPMPLCSPQIPRGVTGMNPATNRMFHGMAFPLCYILYFDRGKGLLAK